MPDFTHITVSPLSVIIVKPIFSTFVIVAFVEIKVSLSILDNSRICKKKVSACCANDSVDISLVSINSTLSIADVRTLTHLSSDSRNVMKRSFCVSNLPKLTMPE